MSHRFFETYFISAYIRDMTREEKLNKINLLRTKASELKKEVDYYNALQLALKLVLNGA